jgi:hypothetical protein
MTGENAAVGSQVKDVLPLYVCTRVKQLPPKKKPGVSHPPHFT